MPQSKKGRLSKRFHRALSYSAELHDGQKRKGTDEPYIGQLLFNTVATKSKPLRRCYTMPWKTRAAGLPCRPSDGNSAHASQLSWKVALIPSRSPSRRGWSGRKNISLTSPTRPQPFGSSVPPTNCTTPAQSWLTIARRATNFGNGSPEARTARSGITARW